MEGKEKIGTLTVGYGSPQQREIEVESMLRATFQDNRLISVSKLVDNEGYCIMVENPESTGRSISQKMWLSDESFMGMLTTCIMYLNHNNVDISEYLKKHIGEEVKYEYAPLTNP